MARRPEKSAGQGDLFVHTELFPVRRPEDLLRPVDLSLRIKTALGQALKECSDSGEIIAARMTEMGTTITGDALYALTAQSKPDHQISVIRLVTFVRATGAKWLWDELVKDDGMVVLEGREARLAQLGHVQQEHRRLAEEMRRLQRELKDEPVRTTMARRRPGEG